MTLAEAQSVRDNNGGLLHSHHQVYHNLLHHHMQTAVDHSLHRAGDWLQPAFTLGPVHLQVSETARKKIQFFHNNTVVLHFCRGKGKSMVPLMGLMIIPEEVFQPVIH